MIPWITVLKIVGVLGGVAILIAVIRNLCRRFGWFGSGGKVTADDAKEALKILEDAVEKHDKDRDAINSSHTEKKKAAKAALEKIRNESNKKSLEDVLNRSHKIRRGR